MTTMISSSALLFILFSRNRSLTFVRSLLFCWFFEVTTETRTCWWEVSGCKTELNWVFSSTYWWVIGWLTSTQSQRLAARLWQKRYICITLLAFTLRLSIYLSCPWLSSCALQSAILALQWYQDWVSVFCKSVFPSSCEGRSPSTEPRELIDEFCILSYQSYKPTHVDSEASHALSQWTTAWTGPQVSSSFVRCVTMLR